MQLWVGTSGYSYPDWVGSFYPPGLRQGKLLSYYAKHFPLVELNFTFYRPPTATMLARLAEYPTDEMRAELSRRGWGPYLRRLQWTGRGETP